MAPRQVSAAGRPAAVDPRVDGAPKHPPSLRDLHKAHIRARLSRAASELQRELAGREPTVEEITDRAGVSRRTYFRYYRSKKEGLFGPLPPAFLDILRARLQGQPGELSNRSAMLRALVELVEKTPPEGIEMARERARWAMARPEAAILRYESWWVEWRPALEADLARRSDTTAPSLEDRATVRFVFAAMELATESWMTAGLLGHPGPHVVAALKALSLRR